MLRYHPLDDRLLDSAIIPKYNLDSLYGTTMRLFQCPTQVVPCHHEKYSEKSLVFNQSSQSCGARRSQNAQQLYKRNYVWHDQFTVPDIIYIYYPALPNWGSVQFHIDSASNTLDTG